MRNNALTVIPIYVLRDTELMANAKIIYAEITAATNIHGYCSESNQYFSDIFKVSNTSISKWINQLIKKGYLVAQYRNIDFKSERRLFINN